MLFTVLLENAKCPGAGADALVTFVLRAAWIGVSCLAAATRLAAMCCSTDGLSYALKPTSKRWPVLSWITFSGTLALNTIVAPVAREVWLVFPVMPASASASHHNITGYASSLVRWKTKISTDLHCCMAKPQIQAFVFDDGRWRYTFHIRRCPI